MELRTEAALVGQILAVLLVLSLGRAGANELSLTVCQDALFRPGAGDSMVHPVAVLVGLGLKLGASGSLDLRVGYSGYANLVRPLSVNDRRTAFSSVSLQAAPVFRVATPFKGATAFGGAGLAVRLANLRQSVRGASDYWRTVTTLGVDQTFLAGLGYEPSHKLDVDLTLERVGFSLAHDVERAYRNDHHQEKDSVEIRGGQNTLDVGWRAGAPVGVGIGLRLKL